MKVNFELFRDIHLGFGKGMALSKGEIFIDWLNELISRDARPNSEPFTFKDLEKDLVVITTNLKAFDSQEFSKHETPDFEIAKAVRISSSMPGLMPPYKFNDADLVDGDLQKASPMWRLAKTLNNSPDRILEFRLEGAYGEDGRNPIAFINTIYSCVTDVATDFVTELYGQNDRYDCVRINTGDIFFADFNLNKEGRRKLINTGYEQTMRYFKEVLPKKKEKLERVYIEIHNYLKKVYKGLKANNVEEVQWWLGDMFILICENKEIIDPNIYELIVELKDRLLNSISTLLFIQKRFRKQKELEVYAYDVIKALEERITDLRLFLSAMSKKH